MLIIMIAHPTPAEMAATNFKVGLRIVEEPQLPAGPAGTFNFITV